MKKFWGKRELNKAIAHLKDNTKQDEERLRELQAIKPYPDDLVARIKNAEPREKYYGYFMRFGKEYTKLVNGNYHSLEWVFAEKELIALADGKDIIVEIEKPFEPSTYKKLSIKEVFDI